MCMCVFVLFVPIVQGITQIFYRLNKKRYASNKQLHEQRLALQLQLLHVLAQLKQLKLMRLQVHVQRLQ